MTATVEHPIFARAWTLLGAAVAGPEERSELLAGLHGRVVEIGAGSGLNFRHYPPEVDLVAAVEPEPYLRRQAERAARDASVAVRVSGGSAEALPLADEECDGAVASLVLCSVSDQAVALGEIRRVLRPAGQLHFYEHVIAENLRGSTIQRSLDRSGLWPRLAAGCHLARDTGAAIRAAGFDIERCRRFHSRPLAIPYVLGTARRR